MLFSEKLKIFAAEHPCENITVNGARFRYVLCGNKTAKTVVLLNGGMNTLEMWMDYVDGLSCCCLIIPLSLQQTVSLWLE